MKKDVRDEKSCIANEPKKINGYLRTSFNIPYYVK